jgi:hypothetical protein
VYQLCLDWLFTGTSIGHNHCLQVGQFFSQYGEVIDCTLVLNLEKVLNACAKISKLDHMRDLLMKKLALLPADHQGMAWS